MPRFDPLAADSTLEVTELVSVGLVSAGANGGADILITKRADDAGKTATAPHSTATSDKTWDAGAARSAYPNEAATLRRYHAWVDPDGDPTAKSSYKFPHHDPDTGAANLAAVRNGLARLSSADIPADDRDAVRRHLAKHLRDGGGEPAEEASLSRLDRIRRRIRELLSGSEVTEEDLAWSVALAADPISLRENLGEWLEAMIHADVTLRADDMFGSGVLTRDERIAISSAVGAMLDAFRGSLEDGDAAGLYDRSRFDPRPGDEPATEDVAQRKDPDSIGVEVPERRREQMPEDALTLSDETREALDPDVLRYVEGLEAAVAEKTDDDPTPDPVEMIKDADPEIRDLVAKIQADADAAKAEAEEARKAAEAEREIRLAAEWTEKAAGFGAVVRPDEFGPILRKISDVLDDDEIGKVEEALSKAQAIATQVDLYREFGATGGTVPGSAAEKADRLAKDRATGSDLTYEQAYDDVLRSDPELSKAVDAEERARSERAGR